MIDYGDLNDCSLELGATSAGKQRRWGLLSGEWCPKGVEVEVATQGC